MSEMVERVARAICEASFQGWPDDTYNGRDQKRFYRNQARAAIEAMLDAEPTEAMMSAMWSLQYSNTKDSFANCWRAMISAALRETVD